MGKSPGEPAEVAHDADSSAATGDPAAATFEQDLAHLIEVVRRLEEGELGLSNSLAQYEQGVRLLKRCYERLEQAEQRIELVQGLDADGRALTTPYEDADGGDDLSAKARSRSRRRTAKNSGDVDPSGGDAVDDPPRAT